MKCRKCHKQVKEDDIFCPACGTKLQFICDNCGSSVDENDSFCRKCGVALKQASASTISFDVAKNLSHHINNALSIILTSSQLALHISKSLYGNLRTELQNLLNDIAEFAENSGVLVHQFQEYINAIENNDLTSEIEEFAKKIINYPQIEAVEKKIKDDNVEIIEIKSEKSRQISVLIVDDESRIRQTMSYAFSLSGHNVITASNGQEAIDHIEKRFYNIAFVDLVLPDIDGWQVIDIIKQKSPNTMTVLMTGWNVKLDDNEVWAKNVDAMLSKPFQLSDVYELIKNL
ncbi:TPA: response regulator [Candidatus Poribacteria bacterium]|nr:response regulator [Candidatus Poribacteria bacterium]